MVQYGGAGDGMEVGRHDKCPVTAQLEVLADFETLHVPSGCVTVLSVKKIIRQTYLRLAHPLSYIKSHKTKTPQLSLMKVKGS